MVGDTDVTTDQRQAAALLELAETDLAIARLSKELDELPVKTELLRLKRTEKELEALQQKANALIAAIEREVKRLEDELAQIDEKIAVTRARADAVAAVDHKELANLMKEVDSLVRHKSKKEDELVDAMERSEKAAEKRAEIDTAIEQAQAKESALADRYRAEGGDIQRRIAELQARRESLAGALDTALLARYEAVKAAKHGIGVGRFEDGRCSVCHIDLPADRVQALESSGPIGECPNCHRILVVSVDR